MRAAMAISSAQALHRYRLRRGLPESACTPDGGLRVLAGDGIRMSLQEAPNATIVLRARVGALPREREARARMVCRVGAFAAGLMRVSPASCTIDAEGYVLHLWQRLAAGCSEPEFDESVALFARTCQMWREMLTQLEQRVGL